MPNKIATVALDLDGTLVESAIDFGCMKTGIIDTFTGLGVEKTLFTVQEPNFQLIDKGLVRLGAMGFSHEQQRTVKASLNRMIRALELESLTRVIPLPGAVQVLQTLRNRRFKIGVLTRSCREYATLALEKCNMTQLLDGLVARDEVENPKPHPDQIRTLAEILDVSLKEMILVGDSVVDLLGARNSGVPFIGVLSGLANEEVFRSYGCQNVIRSIENLPEHLETLNRH